MYAHTHAIFLLSLVCYHVTSSMIILCFTLSLSCKVFLNLSVSCYTNMYHVFVTWRETESSRAHPYPCPPVSVSCVYDFTASLLLVFKLDILHLPLKYVYTSSFLFRTLLARFNSLLSLFFSQISIVSPSLFPFPIASFYHTRQASIHRGWRSEVDNQEIPHLQD